MNLVTVETPATGMALAGEILELPDTMFGFVVAGQLLQVVADQLIQALTERIGFLARPGDQLLIDR